MEALHIVPSFVPKNIFAGNADFLLDPVQLRAMPANPARRIEITSTLMHPHGCPNNRFNMHYMRQRGASKLSDQPINPLKVLAGTPMGNPNIDVIGKRNPAFHGTPYDLGRQETIRPLKHQQEARFGGHFKLEEVRKVHVWIEQNQLCTRFTQQKRIGNLAPTRMAGAKDSKVFVSVKRYCLAIK